MNDFLKLVITFGGIFWIITNSINLWFIVPLVIIMIVL